MSEKRQRNLQISGLDGQEECGHANWKAQVETWSSKTAPLVSCKMGLLGNSDVTEAVRYKSQDHIQERWMSDMAIYTTVPSFLP